MPKFNLTPILFPKPKQDDVYDMLKDLLQIKEKQFAIDEGGQINNPASYNPLIKEYEAIVNDPAISADDRRDAQKQLDSLKIKQLKSDLDQKKRLDVGDWKQMVNQDLRELEFEFPGNPIAYSQGAMTKYNDVLYGTAEREGLGQLIDIFEHNAVDSTNLKEYQVVCQEELSKYSDIVGAYEMFGSSKKEDRAEALKRLGEYAVVYTPYTGKVKAMKIIFKGDTDPSYSQKTNLRFSPYITEDEKLALKTVSESQGGMQVYFIRANATMGDKYSFGNSSFVYGINGWETGDSATFDYKKIKHVPLHSIPSGSFVRDSKEKLYYVNRDRSFYPVQEKYKEELGFSEDKVYNLSPDEEINFLPGAIDRTTFPVFERYNREVSMSDFNYSQAFKEELGPAARKVAGAADIGLAKAGEFIKAAPKSLWEFTKESWAKAKEENRKKDEQMKSEREKAQLKETPSWGLGEVGKLPILEESKKFIKKLGF